MSSFIKKNKKAAATAALEAFQAPAVTTTSTATAAEEKKNKKNTKGSKQEPETNAVAVVDEDHETPESLTATPEDALTKELIDKHVNEAIVKDGLRALVKYEREQQEAKGKSSGKMNLFDEMNVKSILLQMEFTRYNTTFHNVKPIRVKIPHSFYHLPEDGNSDFEFNICLITKSHEKEAIANYFENFVTTSELSNYFQRNSLIPINYQKNITVYSINDLKLYFKQFKNRKSLLKNFTHFFVDNEIALYVYNLLGKTFQEHNKYPVVLHYSKKIQNNQAGATSSALQRQQQLAEGSDHSAPAGSGVSVNFDKIIKEMNKNIYFSTFLFLHSKNIQFKIGMAHMKVADLQENILFGLFYVMKFKLLNAWKHIQCIYLRTKDSPALPVYSHVNYELYEYLQNKLQQKQQQQTVAPGTAKKLAAPATPAPAPAPVARIEAAPASAVKSDKKKKRKATEEVVEEAEEPAEEPVAVKTPSKQKKLKTGK